MILAICWRCGTTTSKRSQSSLGPHFAPWLFAQKWVAAADGRDAGGGEVWKFWADLNEGSKTTLCRTRSNGRIKIMGESCHFGGIGIWNP